MRAQARENLGRTTLPWRGRIAAGGLATGLAVGAMVMLVAPTVLGSVVPFTVLKPPFTTATVKLANPKVLAGCAVGKIVTSTFFNKTTGIGGFSSRGNSTWCAANTNNSVSQTGQITIDIPISVTKTGIHNVTVIWDTIATGSVNITPGRCVGSATIASSSCTRFSDAFVFGTNYIADQTTHTRTTSSSPVWPGNHTSVWANTTCSFTTCTTSSSAAKTSALHTGNAFWSWDWFSISMNASHTYSLHMVLFGGVIVMLTTTGGGTLTGAKGNAQFNSGTLGNEEKLLSITVS